MSDMNDFPWGARPLTLLSRNGITNDDLVSVVEVGSTAHGISIGGDDLDLTVIRMEDFRELVNGPTSRQSMMIRTKPEGERSGPGDIDLQVYTFRKFISLAAGGNPSILNALFSPTRWNYHHFHPERWAPLVYSARAGDAYIGYMVQQIERWEGKRGQKNVARLELVEKYGFDTKYAAHAIRLGLQGVEYLMSGKITIPMAPESQTLIQDIRSGVYSNEEALFIAREGLRDLRKVQDTLRGSIRPRPDATKIGDALRDWYWGWMT